MSARRGIKLEEEVVRVLRDILEEIREQTEILNMLAEILVPRTASTCVFSETGEINMAQTTLKSVVGNDVLSFQTMDNSAPPVDITGRCVYTVTSDGPAVAVGTVAANTAPVTYVAGTANITIKTTDSGGDTIPDVVLAATISPALPPPAGTTTVSAQNPATKIA